MLPDPPPPPPPVDAIVIEPLALFVTVTLSPAWMKLVVPSDSFCMDPLMPPAPGTVTLPPNVAPANFATIVSSKSTSPLVILSPLPALRSVLITPPVISIPSPAVKAPATSESMVIEPFALFVTVMLFPP